MSELPTIPSGADPPTADTPAPTGSLISRRRFVAGSVALVGAGPTLVLAACGSSGTPAPSATPNAWVAVSTADLTAGEPRWVEFDLPAPGGAGAASSPAIPAGTPADSLPASRAGSWLVREADGSVVAFVPNCTHQLCLYDWEAADARFRCRCHPGYFDVEGSVVGGPPPRPLWRFETRPTGPDAIEIGLVARG